MSDDVLERIGVAVAQTGIQMSPEAVRVAARVLLGALDEFIQEHPCHVRGGRRDLLFSEPTSDLNDLVGMQVRQLSDITMMHWFARSLGLDLTSMAAAEPATEPGEGVGRVVDERV